MIARSSKVMFMETTGDSFGRMKGFTSMSINKNPKEYTRQYVDEEFETTDVTGISTSIDYTFDQIADDAVHEKLIDIIDNERIGNAAVVSLVSVDFTKAGSTENTFVATKRDFTTIAGSEGDSLDAYTYGGTFRVKGERIIGEATTTDDWETCTFVVGQ